MTHQNFVCQAQNHKDPTSAPSTPATIRTAASAASSQAQFLPPTPAYSFEDDSRQEHLLPSQRVIPSRPYGRNCGPYVVQRFTLDGQFDPSATGPYCDKQIVATPTRDVRTAELDKEKYRVQVRVWDEVRP